MPDYRYYLFKDGEGGYSGVIRADPDRLTLEWLARGATEWIEDASLIDNVAGDNSRDTVHIEASEALAWIEKIRKAAPL